jgi:SAM-dependent methyltransferase
VAITRPTAAKGGACAIVSDSMTEHRTDCWGRLNEAPDITPAMAILAGLPEGFRAARRAMIASLRLSADSRVLEAGCGPGTALEDLVEVIGPTGGIIGIDPTRAFVSAAEDRARAAGIAHARYAVGDIRHIGEPDASVDAAFCDKILVHVSPIDMAIGEMARVTRRGGRVGVIEWYSQGMSIAADYVLTRRILDGSAPAGALNPMAPLELESLLARAGLSDIAAGTVVAETRQLTPGIQMVLKRRVEQAVELGAISSAEGDDWLHDLAARDASGRAYWGALVRWAAGTR